MAHGRKAGLLIAGGPVFTIAEAVQCYEALVRLDRQDAEALAALVAACSRVDVNRAEQVGWSALYF